MSALKSETKVTLEWIEGEDLEIKFNSELMNDVTIKRKGVPSEKMGGEARKLLAAALAECMCSTLYFLLKWAKVDFSVLRAEAVPVTSKDEKGRLYVDRIDLMINLEIKGDQDDLKRLSRVENLFKRGCLMSRSIKKGIEINYKIITERR